MGGGGAIQRARRDDVNRAGPNQPAGGLEAVYLDRREALVRFLRARGAGDQAEDLVQELWLKVSATPSTPVADPAGYLYRAANNLMISRHRSTQRSGRRDDEWSAAAESADTSGEASVAARLEIERAEERLRALGDRAFRTFVLFRVEGVPQKEIAEKLGVSLSAVEKNLQRAYRAIAEIRSRSDAD
jgi:RNA polymerase sigma-70 factor (ECF subfamily)